MNIIELADLIMEDFRLSEWFKNKDRKVVDEKGAPVTIAFRPLVMMDNGELAGTYHAFSENHRTGPVLCEGWAGTLFFVD